MKLKLAALTGLDKVFEVDRPCFKLNYLPVEIENCTWEMKSIVHKVKLAKTIQNILFLPNVSLWTMFAVFTQNVGFL